MPLLPPDAGGVHHSLAICALNPEEYSPHEYPEDVVCLQSDIPDTLNKSMQMQNGVSEQDVKMLVIMALQEAKDDCEKCAALVKGYLCAIEIGTSSASFIILLEPSQSYTSKHIKCYDDRQREIGHAFNALYQEYIIESPPMQPVQPDAKEVVEKKEKEEVEKKAKVEAGLALIRADEAYAEAERLKAEADRLKDYADKAHGYFIKVNNIKPGFGRLAKEKADEAYAKAERLKVEADEAYAEAERLKVEAADAAETALA